MERGSKGSRVDEGSAGLHGVMGVRVLEPDIRGSKAGRGVERGGLVSACLQNPERRKLVL